MEPQRTKGMVSNSIDIEIDGQPPVEVRTRTPSETRTFTVSAKVVGNYKKLGGSIMKITLFYERNDQADAEVVVISFVIITLILEEKGNSWRN